MRVQNETAWVEVGPVLKLGFAIVSRPAEDPARSHVRIDAGRTTASPFCQVVPALRLSVDLYIPSEHVNVVTLCCSFGLCLMLTDLCPKPSVKDSYVPPLSSMRSKPAASSCWHLTLLSSRVKPLSRFVRVSNKIQVHGVTSTSPLREIGAVHLGTKNETSIDGGRDAALDLLNYPKQDLRLFLQRAPILVRGRGLPSSCHLGSGFRG
jgi:hypothetical protein